MPVWHCRPHIPRLAPALAFARLLTFTPVEATPSALEALIRAGWSLRGIVTLAQLIAFVSFQSRLVVGLRLLNGKNPRRTNPDGGRILAYLAANHQR
jgi:uncharacterized protein YciW